MSLFSALTGINSSRGESENFRNQFYRGPFSKMRQFTAVKFLRFMMGNKNRVINEKLLQNQPK